MPQIAAGLNHIVQYSGVSDTGWRLKPGWRIVETLGVSYLGDDKGSYVMLCHVAADEDLEGKGLSWPPFDDSPPVPQGP